MATSEILMIRPKNFGFNEQTAQTNHFQRKALIENPNARACLEFDRLVSVLRDEGVSVRVYEDREDPVCPDAVFPNNWFSTHRTGELIIYPMMSLNRRREVREDLIKDLSQRPGFRRLIDFRGEQEFDSFLEGTGSLILDHENKILYCSESERSHTNLVRAWADKMSFKPVVFRAFDRSSQPIYHTNVMMALGQETAILCFEAIADPAERRALTNSLEKTKKQILEINLDQMSAFAANALELNGKNGRFWAMSMRAQTSLSASQKKSLGKIVSSELSTIESVGGGSLRCMLAELFF